MSFTDWVKVTRVQTAAVTMLALWGGHITVAPLTVYDVLYLGTLGLLVHTWGFTMNEVRDAEYDRKHSDESSHPISVGKISKSKAEILAFTCLLVFVFYQPDGPFALFEWKFISLEVAELFGMIMILSGFMYNKWSKDLWYSAAFLSLWAFSLVMIGAYNVGMPNTATLLIAVALSIQIFVQVAEGDMKDIKGPENTFLERLGVSYNKTLHIPTNARVTVQTLKTIEAIILYIFALHGLSSLQGVLKPGYGFLYFCLVLICTSLYAYYSTHWMNKNYTREQIKKSASIHEIVSILFIGLCTLTYDTYGALLVAFAPPTWYILTNKLLYTNPLSPDI